MIPYDVAFKARIIQALPNDPFAKDIAEDELNRLAKRTADPVADADRCIKLWDDDGSQMGPV
jgi:hypothetical protein